jgi:integrase/recombinase XerC
VKQEIEAYLAQRTAEGLAKRTIDVYRKRLMGLRRYLRTHEIRRFSDVIPAHMDGYMQYLRDKGLKIRTQQGRAATTRSFFRALARQGKVLSDPARGMQLPDDDELPLLEAPLEENEAAEFINELPKANAFDLRNRLHVELLYSCGLRINESVSMNVSDFDLVNKTLVIRAGKGGKSRVLPLMRGVIGALKDYLVVRRGMLKGPDDGALLLNKHGQRLRPEALRHWLRKYCRVHEYRRIHPHLFRHSIAVHLLRNGADIRYVQEFLGHANLDVTKTYLRLVPGRLKEDYDTAMPEISIDR